MVNKISHLPFYVQIENDLYEQISSGELPPGSQLPSEPELAGRYSVARMTVRKAIDSLVARGFIFRQPGKGTFVTEGVLSYRLSTTLSFSETMRARGFEVRTQVLRLDVIPAPLTVARELKLAVNSNVVLVRRLRFVADKPAAIHTSFLDYRVYAPLLEADLATESLLADIERISGPGTISYSIDAVHAAFASSEDSELLQIPLGSPVLGLEGTSFTAQGQPIHYNKATYPGDMFKLVVVNTTTQSTSLKISDTLSGNGIATKPEP